MQQALGDGLVESNPAGRARAPRAERQPPTVLPVRDVLRLIFILTRVDDLFQQGTNQNTRDHRLRMLRENLEYSESEHPQDPDLLASLGKLDPKYGAMVALAAFAGLRFGEVAALRPSHLDLDSSRPLVRVDAALTEVRGVVSIGPPKTKASRRVVPLPSSQPVLDLLRKRIEGSRWTYRSYPVDEADPLLFRTHRDLPLSPSRWRARVWKRAVDFLELEPRPTFHDLRHTYAAQLIAVDVHDKAIQTFLGHSSIKTTMDVYGSLMDGVPQDQIAKLASALNGS